MSKRQQLKAWSYRMIRSAAGYVGIYEVYFDDQGVPCACTIHPVSAVGDTPEELKQSFERMQDAFKHDVLDMALFEAKREQAISEIVRLGEELEADCLDGGVQGE